LISYRYVTQNRTSRRCSIDVTVKAILHGPFREQSQSCAMLGGDASPSAAEIKALEAAVQQLQSLALGDKKDKSKKKKGSRDSRKHRKHSKDRKKKKKRSKKSKKSRRPSSSTSSSSSTSRSRSRSSSTSSRSRKPLAWKESGRDKGVSYTDLNHVEQLKLKKKGDLISFAARHPGALTAHFLAGVYARLSKGTTSRTSQLREVSVASWAHQFSGLTRCGMSRRSLASSSMLALTNA